ncbi:MAG: hypothetical protein U0174_18110 [Polyangiaceae bacterium]
MKQIGALGFSALVLTIGVAAFAGGPGPQAPKANVPGAGAAPTVAPSSAPIATVAPAAAVYFKPSVGGKDTTQYSAPGPATARCSENDYQLNIAKMANGMFDGYCAKSGVPMPDTITPNCPGGWGYMVTDDKFLPNIKQHFGNVDQCFKNNDSRNKKEDIANYKPANCVIGANGMTGGFEIKVKNGPDICEREVQGWAFQSPGNPASTKKIWRVPEGYVNDLKVSCPPLSYMWVDDVATNRKFRVTTNAGIVRGGGIYCQKG